MADHRTRPGGSSVVWATHVNPSFPTTSLHNGNEMVAANRELPASGYALEVDGRLKAEFATRDSARAGGEELKKRFPMLQIRIYDAQTNARGDLDPPTGGLFCMARAASAASGSREPSRFASRPRGVDPSRKDYRSSSPGALGKGARLRRSLSLPLSRVPLLTGLVAALGPACPFGSLCSRSPGAISAGRCAFAHA